MDGVDLDLGAYEVDVWTTDTSVALTPFETTIEIDYY